MRLSRSVLAYAAVFAAAPAWADSPGAPAATDAPSEEPVNAEGETPGGGGSDLESYSDFEPGKGFPVAKASWGELSISAYAVIRWLDQIALYETYTDHLGVDHPVDGRNDIQFHRALVHFKGWIYDPKLQYVFTLWTVNSTNQIALIGAFDYQLGRALTLHAGVAGLPGTRSMLGSHPYWLGHDRVMADEYFRPGFTAGVWATGEPVPRFFYDAMVGNNLSQLGVTAKQLTRDLTYGGSLWWMPTTGEFGPKGAYGDFEDHHHLATRFGVGGTWSRENRYSPIGTASSNTQTRLSDSLNLFDEGALAPGVTVSYANVGLLSVDAGFKLHGVFLQTQYFFRDISHIEADGDVPVRAVDDQGFYVQLAGYPVRQRWELYAATSQIFDQFDRRPWEVLGGTNVYPAKTRDYRINGQVSRVVRSPVDSSFGYYVGGLDGWSVAVATSIQF